MWKLLQLWFLAFFSFAYSKSYDGHQMVRYYLQNKAQLNIIRNLVQISDYQLKIMKMVNCRQVDMLVSPEGLDLLSLSLNLDYEVLVEDVQLKIDQQSAENTLRKRQSNVYDDIFLYYHDSDKLNDYLQQFKKAEAISLGRTFEGRLIKGVKFGTGDTQIVITGGVHAREWISPATVTYVAAYLLGDSEEALSLREKFTFHVIPVVNLDGYYYSQTEDRLWRKNREYNENSACIGVDINRNFGFKWGQGGSSPKPCDEDYRGPKPMSTLEAQHLDRYLSQMSNVIAYTDIHSYSQVWVYPYGHTNLETPSNIQNLKASAIAGVNAIKSVYGTDYASGNAYELTYQTTGTTQDYFYAVRNVNYTMTLELRDRGLHGFLLPREDIIPVGEETLRGLITFWSYIQ